MSKTEEAWTNWKLHWVSMAQASNSVYPSGDDVMQAEFPITLHRGTWDFVPCVPNNGKANGMKMETRQGSGSALTSESLPPDASPRLAVPFAGSTEACC